MPEKQKDKDIEENKVVAALSYIGMLCLIALLVKKESKFAQFHGKQGLVLFIGWVSLWIIGMIPFIGWIIFFVGAIVLLVLSILGLTQTLSGNYWKIPFLSQYAEKIKL